MTTEEILENIAGFVAEWVKTYITGLAILIVLVVFMVWGLCALDNADKRARKQEEKRK